MSSYESVVYEVKESHKVLEVPLYVANEQNAKDYGRFVPDFEREEVWVERWPAQGWRQVAPGTGDHAGVVEGDYVYNWENGLLGARNQAVGMGFTIAMLPSDVTMTSRTHTLSWEFNYHPDSGQVFYPRDNAPFVALVAKPGDDVKPEDFVAFYFDGSQGFQLRPNVWHQAMLPSGDTAEFRNKQGRVFACVPVDTVKEFNTFLRIPLMPKYAQAQ